MNWTAAAQRAQTRSRTGATEDGGGRAARGRLSPPSGARARVNRPTQKRLLRSMGRTVFPRCCEPLTAWLADDPKPPPSRPDELEGHRGMR